MCLQCVSPTSLNHFTHVSTMCVTDFTESLHSCVYNVCHRLHRITSLMCLQCVSPTSPNHFTHVSTMCVTDFTVGLHFPAPRTLHATAVVPTLCGPPGRNTELFKRGCGVIPRVATMCTASRCHLSVFRWHK
jgi:hypothetical protein